MSKALRIVCLSFVVALAACGGKKSMDCKSAAPRPQLSGSSNDPVLLRYKYGPGEKLGMDIAMNINMNIKADDQKANMAMKIVMSAMVEWKTANDKELTGELAFTKAAIDVDGAGMPGGANIHWTSDQEGGNPAFDALKAMIGPKITVKISTRGELLATDWSPITQAMQQAGAAADMLDSMTNDEMLKSSFIMLPENPVKAGDEWDAGEIVKKIQPAGQMKMKMKYKVLAVAGDKSRVLLEAKPDIDIDASGGPMQIEAKKIGSDVWIEFDSGKGGIDQANVKMCMDMSISGGGESGDADIDMDAQYKETRL